MKKLFLYRLKEKENRDACAYIDTNPSEFTCGHYFSSVGVEGACYSGHTLANYEDIDTVLTESEYNDLLKFKSNIESLGYGIKKDDERYKKGLQFIEDIKPIYEKLQSDEAMKFFENIIEDERLEMMNEYNLSEEDIEDIFDSYHLDYKDKGSILYVFEDTYELGYEEIRNHVELPDFIQNYVNYEEFGEDLIRYEDYYVELEDGRIVYLAYQKKGNIKMKKIVEVTIVGLSYLLKIILG